MYRHFNIQQFYVLPTQCIYVFCVDLRTNSDYFPIQHIQTGPFNGSKLFSMRYELIHVSLQRQMAVMSTPAVSVYRTCK